ncbi:MAG: dTDP-4-dehydrorhamnose 3,5-epimerase [Planctomycetaceae bacterium]
MQVIQTELPGVLIIEPRVFRDPRGFFKETYQKDRYRASGIDCEFVQDNVSSSCRGTVRGLHYQLRRAQAKLVQVLLGEVFDVAVDLRRGSPTFGRWAGTLLTAENHRQLFVPPGFAHGFCVISAQADIFYKCSDYYFPEHERTLLWNDPQVNIEWPLSMEPVLSDKDQRGTALGEIEAYPPMES